ncbi:MAG: FHA domain-containing serine/threonine-protein kinase [Chloroflexota bacterium]
MVMEFINGGSLQKEVEKSYQASTKLKLSKGIRMVQYMGTALSYAHNQNVIHGDVKPSNVLIEDTARVVLTDFGLGKLRTDNGGSRNDIIPGTTAYMSPEQGMGMPFGPASDIYSLGAVLYEVVTGRQPFSAQNPLDVVTKHFYDEPPAPREIWPEVPKRVEAVILNAMQKNPHDRYASVDLMLDDINNLEEEDTKKELTATLSLSRDVVSDLFMPVTTRDTQVSLHIMNTGQIILLDRGKKYLLGRTNSDRNPDIDLTQFKEHEWGISRLHAELNLEDKVTIRDLESVNGTWLLGNKLSPWEETTLKHGEIISLGKLKLQVLIYD